ncbi:MAG: metalloregulator ArsR/SmtB family transcription factor [Phycisphaeraceae bacterium]
MATTTTPRRFGVKHAAQTFRAMADPTRLRLLHLLTRGERCVCELVDTVDQPQPTVSRHLAYLRRAGLVAARKDGLWVHYRLTEPHDELQRRLLDCIGCCFGDLSPFNRDMSRLAKCCRPGDQTTCAEPTR